MQCPQPVALPEEVPGTECVRLEPPDIPELVDLEGRCFSLPWTEREFTAAFGQSSFFAFGLRETGADRSLVAYVSLYHTPDELEILNIAVRSEQRDRGHGRRLLGSALRIAEKMGIVRSVLEVRPSNIPAIRLYEHFGFKQVGKRRGYYPDTGEDALVYALELSPQPRNSGDYHA